MSLAKLLAYGTIGYIAYRAWQRHQETSGRLVRGDDGQRAAPHGDPVLAGERIDIDCYSIRDRSWAPRGGPRPARDSSAAPANPAGPRWPARPTAHPRTSAPGV